MLPKSYRLNRRNISVVYKKGHSLRQKIFVLQFLKNRIGHWRFAIVISKKIVPLATARNRLKRLIITKLIEGISSQLQDYDIILRLTEHPKSLNFPLEVKEELKKAGLLK